MFLIAAFGILLVVAAGLGITAWQTREGFTAVITLFSSIVGGLIAVIGQELYRQQEERTRRKSALAALREEVKLNLKIAQNGTDEKQRIYITSAWEAFRSDLGSLKSVIANSLAEGYEAAYMHRQAFQLELMRTGFGGALLGFTDKLKLNFEKARKENDWSA